MRDDLAKGGVTADEFDRAITPVRKNIAEYRRQNTYWLGRVLAGSQAFPQHLENARTLPAAYDQITPAQVSAAAKEYLGAEHAVRVLVLPEAPAPPPRRHRLAMKILVADDHQVNRRLLRVLLEEEGFRWSRRPTAAGAGRAEALMEPCVGLIDWQMPELEGPEVCRRARFARTARRCSFSW